jgi:hypothetical protein
MKRFFLATTIAAGMLVFTTPGVAQFVPGSTQTPGFNGNAGMKGKRNGPNDGTGNQGQRPQDGTGHGAKSGKKGGAGNWGATGTCDGTGPKGQSSQGRGSMGGRGGGRR